MACESLQWLLNKKVSSQALFQTLTLLAFWSALVVSTFCGKKALGELDFFPVDEKRLKECKFIKQECVKKALAEDDRDELSLTGYHTLSHCILLIVL